jgi:hypothetical protein
MKLKKETIRLTSSHGLILGNEVPDPHYVPNIPELSRLGLFDSSSPNYVTFVPGTSQEDFTPKDSDFIYPSFRLLSETQVRNGWSGVIDFSEPGVLKEAMPLFLGQTVYPDHEMSVGNALGSVASVEWQEARVENGVTIPAGVNGKLKIDAVANPRIARLLLMKPPGIHSSSTTVSFAWKKSHEGMGDDEFEDKMGSFGEDGRLICKQVTKIDRIYEQSLVSHGADKFAKINQSETEEAANSESARSFVIDYSNLKDIQSFNFNPMNTKKKTDPPEGASEFSMPENLQAIFEVMPDITLVEIQGLQAQPTRIDDAQLTELNNFKGLGSFEEVTAQIELGKTFLAEVRAETIKKYKLSTGPDKVNEVILQTLEGASLSQLKAFGEEYETSLNEKLPLTCTSCGSTDVSRASVVNPRKPIEVSSSAEDSIRSKKRQRPSSIHR